jgi:hypothetical protein
MPKFVSTDYFFLSQFVCRKIVDKIDKDGDGDVTEAELREWIQHVQKRYIVSDTERMWKDHQPDDDNMLSWPAYQKRTFGYDDGMVTVPFKPLR